MGSFWSRDVTRGEEDGGEKTPSDSEEGSECAGVVVKTDVDRETQEPGVAEMSVGASSSSVSWYHSTRIQRMMEKRGEFSSDVESEIESSKSHWSEMDPAVSEAEHSRKANREYFEVLKRRRYVREGGQLVAKQLESIDEDSRWSMFSIDWDGLVVGEKIAEGGQAEIYAARDGDGGDWAVKVFKAGSVLEHLEKQLPPALLKFYQNDEDLEGFELIKQANGIIMWGAMLLKDERFLDRFAFVMMRQWGDLRKLIDEQMIESCNEGPPFPPHVAYALILHIAFVMKSLHEVDPPILHNDLKAANILVKGTKQDGPLLSTKGTLVVHVADYECSVGVMGTGFWRAPEILQQVKDKIPMVEVVVTEKCDVYSFGMVCYEIVSGRMPYEDYDFREGCDLILRGERLELPPDLHPQVRKVIRKCWHPNPSKRPRFKNIYDNLPRNCYFRKT